MVELVQNLLCLVLLTAIFLFFLTLKRSAGSSDARLPPGPWPLPVLGNLLDLGPTPHRSLARLAVIHGPVMSLKLGSIYTVVISSPSFAKEALQTRECLSDRHIPVAVQALGHAEISGVWLPPNQSWRYLRTLMKTHLFNSHSLDSTKQLRWIKVQKLVSYIKRDFGKPVLIGRAAFCTALNLISSTFLSFDMVDLESDSAQEVKDLMWRLMEESARSNISDFFPLLAPLDLQGRRRRFAASIKKLYDFFEQVIEDRLSIADEKSGGMSSDILDVLLQLSREENSQLNRRTIKALLLDLFVAGSETSSTTLEWAMAELLHQPELMTKARTEIANVIGFDHGIEESDIPRLPFLQAVLKETFRLHPPVPLLLPHKAMENTEINGYMVPKNSQVLVNVWAIGRDDRIWENPNSFVPERFLEGRDIDFRGQHFELIPFGSGRRICPGLPLGVRMVQLMLASLIQYFEWSLPEGMLPKDLDLSEKFGLTLAMASPLKALANPNCHSN